MNIYKTKIPHLGQLWVIKTGLNTGIIEKSLLKAIWRYLYER